MISLSLGSHNSKVPELIQLGYYLLADYILLYMNEWMCVPIPNSHQVYPG